MMTGSSETLPRRIDDAFRQSRTITLAIGGSLVVFTVLVLFAGQSLPPPGGVATLDKLRIALFAVAGLIVFMTTIIKGMILRNPPAGEEQRLARLRSASTLAAALSEVPVILGFILYFTGRLTGDFYILLAVSAYMLARHFPRREQWDDYVLRGGRGAR